VKELNKLMPTKVRRQRREKGPDIRRKKKNVWGPREGNKKGGKWYKERKLYGGRRESKGKNFTHSLPDNRIVFKINADGRTTS